MYLKVGTILLPSPVSVSIDDEIIWSADTGRTLSGDMVGDAVTEKKTLGVKWEFLEETECLLIKRNLLPGFFPLAFYDDGQETQIEGYRATLSKDVLGDIGDGIYYYRSVSVSIIQR